MNFVQDRAGHDFRYAIDADKIESELGWKAEENFESGILKTIDWYLNNKDQLHYNCYEGNYFSRRIWN